MMHAKKEGRAYIEGGGLYQQRTDTYSDLIDELLFEPNVTAEQSSFEEQKTQIQTQLKHAEESFFRTGKKEQS